VRGVAVVAKDVSGGGRRQHDTPWGYSIATQPLLAARRLLMRVGRFNPLDLRPMDPRDDPESLAGGVDCAACGAFVPTGRIRVLARRDDIVFLEVACPACRSDSLGIVISDAEGETDSDRPPIAVGPGRPYGEFGSRDIERFHEALPIGVEDLEQVRQILAVGGLEGLVGPTLPPDPSGPGSPR
jgi:hypothetical protein